MKTIGSFMVLILSLLVCSLTVFAKPVPVILDTDIGSDIADTWALSLILCCTEELSLKLVVTDSHDTIGKAKIAAKFLERVAREDVAVGIGEKFDDRAGPQAGWAKDYDLKSYPGAVYEDGIQAMVDTIMAATETVNLIVTGPCPNLPIALQREPDIVRKVKVFAASGSVRRGYNKLLTPDAEFNVRDNVPASKIMYQASWDLTIAPLDTTGVVQIGGPEYQMLMLTDNPVVQTLYENYKAWVEGGSFRQNPDVRSTSLYDIVPVYLVMNQSFCGMEDIRLVVDDRGLTVPDARGRSIHCAMEWKKLDDFVQFTIDALKKGTTTKRQIRLIGAPLQNKKP